MNAQSATHHFINIPSMYKLSLQLFNKLPYKSPGTTALIAFLGGIVGLAGRGHMYVGKVRSGTTILIGGILLFIISI